jgi:DNA-binding NarL/FixJ family response regulator
VVSDLIGGFALHFVERSSEKMDGMRSPLRLLAVMTEQHLEPQAKPAREASLDALTPREREVLTLVAEGLSNAVIANRLRLSDHTVKRHVANMLLKLDLPTRAAAAALIGAKKPLRGL